MQDSPHKPTTPKATVYATTATTTAASREVANTVRQDVTGDRKPNPLRHYVFDGHYEALVTEVGVVASLSVKVMAVVVPSSFFTVSVVPLIAFSCKNCWIANTACASVGATPSAAYASVI